VRVILDTNVWSRIGDEGSARELDVLAKDRGATILIPPSMLLEIARNPNADVRRRQLDAMLAVRAEHMTSEAELESRELIAEARRCKSQWLRATPNTASEATWHTLWTKKVWREARDDVDTLVARAGGTVADQQELTHIEKLNRSSFLAEYKNTALRLDGWTVQWEPHLLPYYRGGWPDGPEVEAWRAETLPAFWEQLVVRRNQIHGRYDTTFTEWIGARLDLQKVAHDPAEFCGFFLRDIVRENVPRMWLRWAVRMLQRGTKILPSNAYDEQHSAYLPSCDVFLSCDIRFSAALEAIQPHAPFEMCAVGTVPTSSRPVLDDVRVTLEAAMSKNS
jgi:hypothetical protein